MKKINATTRFYAALSPQEARDAVRQEDDIDYIKSKLLQGRKEHYFEEDDL